MFFRLPGLKSILVASLVTSLLFLTALSPYQTQAREFSIGTETEAKMVNAQVIDSPMPEIPSDYQKEAFKSLLTARFNIAADAKFTVALLDSSGVEEIDKLVLKTLKKWKFKAATLDDKPVASTRKLRIEIEVE